MIINGVHPRSFASVGARWKGCVGAPTSWSFMALPRFLAKQFALPQGLLGGLVGQLMARINKPTTAALIDRLAPALDEAEAVLEIGYGPGLGSPWLRSGFGRPDACLGSTRPQ